MDKSDNDFAGREWPFPWDPYLELRKSPPPPPALTEEPAPTTKRSSLPPAPPTAAAPSIWTVLAGKSSRSARSLPSAPVVGPSSATRRKLELPWQMDDSAPPTHFGIEPPATEFRRRSSVWVVGIVAALGLLVWLTLQLPSFAMQDMHRSGNTEELHKSRPAALAGDVMKPPSAAALETGSPIANEPPVEPGPPPPKALPRRSGEIPAETAAKSVQVVKTTTGKGMKPSAEGSRKAKPSAAEPPAPRRVVPGNVEPVYPDPEPARPAPPTPLIPEGEIFNRPSASPS